MHKRSTIKENIAGVIQSCSFAVLATEGDGQPHTSLIAITPYGSFGQLVFATYRNTLKYRNLLHNGKVAVLIESGDIQNKGLHKRVVLTIIGHTEEASRNGILHAFA
jgi:general stress protein 26